MTYGVTGGQARSASALPTGTVTFLLTDIEGSTRLWERHREGMRAALVRHDVLIEQVVAEHGGVVVRPRGEGDSRFAVFTTAAEAVAAACSIQIALAHEPVDLPEPLRVRMAIHTSEADQRDGDYYGSGVNRCARLRGLARGGQILVSGTTAMVVRDQPLADVALKDLGSHKLKDLLEPEQVFQVCHPELPATFPPLPLLHETITAAADSRGATRLPAIGTPAERRARARMLEKVRLDWIKGVLEPSLHGVRPLRLGLVSRPDLVEPPLVRLVQPSRRHPEPLPPGTTIDSLFDASGASLLIVGPPGGGKTTLLLELADSLLDRAEHDADHPIPVVFVLSSCSKHGRPLEAWLVDELANQYYVPRGLAQAWVDAELILPLLDGLDEMPAEQRDACADAIAAFRQRHGLQPLAVCSRTGAYEELHRYLPLPVAVELQPPTRQQAEGYLHAAAPGLLAGEAGVLQDPAMSELLNSPLMLGIVAAAPASVTLAAGHGRALEDQRSRHLQAYVETMLARRPGTREYPPDRAVRWLAWLASAMDDHGQGVFHIESMQPGWLGDQWQQRLVTFGPAVLLFLAFGLGPLAIGTTPSSVPLSTAVVSALSTAIIAAALGFSRDIRPVEVLRWTWWSRGSDGSVRETWRRLRTQMLWLRRRGMLIALTSGFVLSSGATVTQDWGDPKVDIPALAWTTCQMGILGLLQGWLVYAIYRALDGGVSGALPGALAGAAGGILVGIATCVMNVVLSLGIPVALGAIMGPPPPDFEWTQFAGVIVLTSLGSFGFSVALGSGLLGGLLGGLARGELTIRTRANEGMHRSARNAIVTATFVTGTGLVATLVQVQSQILMVVLAGNLGQHMSSTEPASTSTAVLANAVVVGLLLALPFGARACLQHVVLRMLLWRAACIPWDYTRFLDDAVDRVLLRKVGGGYIFVHRLLQEYFAALEIRPTDRSSAAPIPANLQPAASDARLAEA